MLPISFKDCPLTINSNKIIANAASLSISNPKSPVFSVGGKKISGKVKDGTIKGIIDFTFLLSNHSFIKELINKEEKTSTLITGDLGGITFSNGRLESLSFSIEPNEIIWAQASISFWGAPQSSLASENNKMVVQKVGSGSGSEVTCSINNGATNEELDGISSYSYSLNITYQDVFFVGNLIPDYFITNIQEVVDVKLDTIGKIMSECGETASINSTIKDGCGETFLSFDVTGDLTTQELSANIGEFVSGSVTVTKDY